MTYTLDEIREQAAQPRREVAWRADMLDATGTVLRSLPVVGGQIEFRGEQAEQWACALRLTDPALVPLSAGDLLDPRSGGRCQMWWLLRMPDGGWAEVPCGRYTLEDPDITDDGTVAYTLTGREALAQARRGGYTGTVSVGGLTVTAALRTLFEQLAPGTPVVIGESSVVVPVTFELAEGDPGKDWTDIAALAGWVVRTDAVGTIVAGPAPEPDQVAADWQEGPDCAVEQLTRKVSTSSMINRVVAISTNPEIVPPIVGVVEDDDPGSSTWVGRYGPYQTTIRSDAIADLAGAEGMARATYERWRHPMETVEVQVPARPDLGYRDLVALARRQAGASGEYRVSGWTATITAPHEPPARMRVQMMTRAIQ